MMGLKGKYSAAPSPLDESLLQKELQGKDAKEYTRTLAEAKALALAETLTTAKGGGAVPTLVLGSDTIVDLEGKILEKPADEAAAISMLTKLSNNMHEVHTGVAIYLVKDETVAKVFSFTDTAAVTFATLSVEDIESYVGTGEPMDKAGSYGIQGIGGQFVQSVTGDFFTVMGLPMHRTSVELTKAIQSIIS